MLKYLIPNLGALSNVQEPNIDLLLYVNEKQNTVQIIKSPSTSNEGILKNLNFKIISPINLTNYFVTHTNEVYPSIDFRYELTGQYIGLDNSLNDLNYTSSTGVLAIANRIQLTPNGLSYARGYLILPPITEPKRGWNISLGILGNFILQIYPTLVWSEGPIDITNFDPNIKAQKFNIVTSTGKSFGKFVFTCDEHYVLQSLSVNSMPFSMQPTPLSNL